MLDLNELRLTEYNGEELRALERRIHTEYARREAIDRDRIYKNLVNAIRETREHFPNDDLCIEIRDADGNWFDYDLLQGIEDNIEQIERLRHP